VKVEKAYMHPSIFLATYLNMILKNLAINSLKFFPQNMEAIANPKIHLFDPNKKKLKFS
jgi:hypothetical protein